MRNFRTPQFDVELKFERKFRIQMYRRSRYAFEDEGLKLSIVIEPDAEPLLVRANPLSQPHCRTDELLSELKSEVVRFYDQGIVPTLDKRPPYSIDDGVNEGVYYQQIVIAVADSSWWVARMAAKLNSPNLYLLHWTGPEKHAPEIVSMMATFEPLTQ